MNFSVKEYLTLLEEAGQVIESNLYQMGTLEVTGITYDSLKATPGSLFICKGASFKKEYLEEAVARGSIGYISEKEYGIEQIPCILVKDIRETMPLVAEKFYQVIPEKLRCIGITGTKGKTTTAYYIRGIFDEYMKKMQKKEIAYLTSVETYDGEKREAASITTPESMELYRHFHNAQKHGISYLAMEVSSQALKYGRVKRIVFDTGVFLNISEDHISPVEHKNFTDYFESKLQMFHQVKTAVVNLDSEFSRRILKEAAAAERIVTFGKKMGADIFGHNIRAEEGKVKFTVSCDQFEEDFALAMHGLFNVENALAAIAVAYVHGIPAECIRKGLAHVTVEGRMEEYRSEDGKLVAIVDYAHNGLSFEKIFASVRQEYPNYKMVTVFGCPGGKALNRRRDMGLAAGNACSKVYLSADDPGAERVEDINEEISRFVETTGCPYECISDREKAITKAMEEADAYTVILVLGKGGENSQRIGQKRCSYKSDPEVVKNCLARYEQKKSIHLS